MSKARMYGARSAYVPNAKADARYKKKFHEHGKTYAESDEERIPNGHQLRKLQRWCNNRFIFAKCKTFEEYGKG